MVVRAKIFEEKLEVATNERRKVSPLLQINERSMTILSYPSLLESGKSQSKILSLPSDGLTDDEDIREKRGLGRGGSRSNSRFLLIRRQSDDYKDTWIVESE